MVEEFIVLIILLSSPKQFFCSEWKLMMKERFFSICLSDRMMTKRLTCGCRNKNMLIGASIWSYFSTTELFDFLIRRLGSQIHHHMFPSHHNTQQPHRHGVQTSDLAIDWSMTVPPHLHTISLFLHRHHRGVGSNCRCILLCRRAIMICRTGGHIFN